MIIIVPILIYGENNKQRSILESIINNYILIEELDMYIQLSTDKPYDIIKYLQRHPNNHCIYFIDMEFELEISGIKLGILIREKDIYGKIIFINANKNFLPLTFTYKIEALDFILKEEIDVAQKKICDALSHSQKYYESFVTNDPDRLKIRVGNTIKFFTVPEIMFIESSHIPHKLTLHLENSTLNFYGILREVEDLSAAFFRTHKSYVVNINNICSIDKKNRIIKMKNSEKCLLSVRRLKKLNSVITADE